jgi:hypothetical protein
MSLGCCCNRVGPGVHVHLMLLIAPACANKLLRAACLPYVAGFCSLTQASSICSFSAKGAVVLPDSGLVGVPPMASTEVRI